MKIRKNQHLLIMSGKVKWCGCPGKGLDGSCEDTITALVPFLTQCAGKVKTHDHTKPRRPMFTAALMPNSPKVPGYAACIQGKLFGLSHKKE